MFRDHREFFLTYRLPGEHDLKAVLRLRYALKNYDPETGKEYTSAEIQALPEKQRRIVDN